MLVLSRKDGEKIHFGTEEDFRTGKQVIVTFWAENCPRMQAGIAAHNDIIILRDELVAEFVKKLKNEPNIGKQEAT